MRRYKLHFGPADGPDERQLYLRLYPLLRSQSEAFTVKGVEIGSPAPGGRADEGAAPARAP